MNSTMVTLQNVRRHAEQLLTSIGVSRIIVIDDEYREFDVEDLIGLCSVLGPDRAVALPHLNDIDFCADREIWGDLIRERWLTLHSEEQESVLAQARAASIGASTPSDGDDLIDPEKEDTKAAQSLAEILGQLQGCQYITLSLNQWRLQRRTFLKDDRAEKTVFLFDRDFRNEAGSENEGINLISEVQRTNAGCCGLLSHTVNIEGEHDAWRQISEDYDLNRDTFIVIAKERLTHESSGYCHFLDMLRLVGLCGRYAGFKSATWSIFEKSVDKAATFVEGLSVFDFDRIVFGSSRKEGVWEPDTLFRMFGILMRREARKQLYRDNDLLLDVTKARRISASSEALADALGEKRESREALRIQRFESYELTGDLNQFHVPIELGDIFERISTRRRYILLAQPCDLMVRRNGKRSYDNKCGRTAALVELAFDAERRVIYDGKKKKESWGELAYYHEDTGGSAFVEFAKVHQALLAVLDLCVFDTDGIAKINVDGACPDLLNQPWKKRYKRMKQLFRAALERYGRLRSKQLPDALNLLALPGLAATCGLHATVDNRTVEYDLRRVMRLRQPWSGALLTAFAQYQARAAFEHPFYDQVQTRLETSSNQELENNETCGATS